MPRIRPFQPGDEAALSEICLKTADAGADATGIFADDDLWGEVFVLPYAARHPDLAFVVETDDGRVAGYIVGTTRERPRTGSRASRGLGSPSEGRSPTPSAPPRSARAKTAPSPTLTVAAAVPSRSATPIPRTCTSTCCPNCRGRGSVAASSTRWSRRSANAA